MKTLKKIMLLFAIIPILGCKQTSVEHTAEKNIQSIFLFRDKDGLYQYDFAKSKEKLVFKLEDSEIFLEETYQLSGDTLTVGMVGQEATSGEYEGMHYFNYYHSVDLKTGKHWVSREIQYETNSGDKTLRIKVFDIDPEMRQKVVSDTITPYRGVVYSYHGLLFNDDKPRFYSEHQLGDKKAYSENGSLYLETSNDDGTETEALIENEHFDPKFGSGYLQPQLDPKGTYVLYTFHPGFLKEGASLQKITLDSKKVEILNEGQFANPQFCADGKFILFGRDTKRNDRDAWESDIYILDLKTLEETKIAKAAFAQWRK